MTVDMAGWLGSASEKHVYLLTKIRLVLQFLSAQTKNYTTLKGNNTAHGKHKCLPIFTIYRA